MRNAKPLLMALPLLFSMGCASSSVRGDFIGKGMASWYGPGLHGRRTASGEKFNMNDMTAAHRTLPFGSRVRVLCLESGKEVVVRINDRGPYGPGRIIDLSRKAAKDLGIIQSGLKEVEIYRVRE